MDYENLPNLLLSFDHDHVAAFGLNHYISSREKEHLLGTYAACYSMLSNKLIFQYIRSNASKFKIDLQLAASFVRKYAALERDIAAHNEQYVDAKVAGNAEYFNNILKEIDPDIRLDDEQRRAVVTDDDYCLLVAGAGAGKTTTIAAKVRYLVDKQGVKPEDIIVISYTNKAIDELKERINKGLKIPAKICTFHSFAYEIVRKFNDQPPEVNFSSYKIIFDMLERAVFDNKPLMKNLVLFMGYYFDLSEDVFKYESLNEYHLRKAAQDYETIKSSLGEYIRKVEHQRSWQTKTLTDEYLRSIHEVQIANFLYLNGLNYEYERAYSYEIRGAKKKYMSDFCITQGEHTAYLEHYALTESDYSNVFTTAQIEKYKTGIRDKRSLHKRYGTTLLETWSFYKDRRPIFEHLKEILEKEGFVLKPRDFTEVYHKLVETGKDKYVYKLIIFLINFIEQYKTTGYTSNGFSVLRAKTDNPGTLLFLDIARQVYEYYQETLKARNELDFADMINDAHFYLQEIENQGKELPYKYIIIDEFQDIARQRFNLTKRLSEITHAKVLRSCSSAATITTCTSFTIRECFRSFPETRSGVTNIPKRTFHL